MDASQLTPRQIVEELDKYIVGQTNAKRAEYQQTDVRHSGDGQKHPNNRCEYDKHHYSRFRELVVVTKGGGNFDADFGQVRALLSANV